MPVSAPSAIGRAAEERPLRLRAPSLALRKSLTVSVHMRFLAFRLDSGNGREQVVENSAWRLGFRRCTNRRNRTRQHRACAGCSTTSRRRSRPGCAGRRSRRPWRRCGPSSAPPCSGSSWPAGWTARWWRSRVLGPFAAASPPATRSSWSYGPPTAPSIWSATAPPSRSRCRRNRPPCGRRRARPSAGTSSRWPSASSRGDGSRSGSPWWTAPVSTGRSRRSATTTSRSPSTTRARRAVGRPCGRAGSWGSPRWLRSVFLRRADERVLARPVGRLLVHALDVALELQAVHPPDAAPAELDRRQLAAADQRVDLGGADVEDRGHVLQRVEPGLDAGCGHEVLLARWVQAAGRFRPLATADP